MDTDMSNKHPPAPPIYNAKYYYTPTPPFLFPTPSYASVSRIPDDTMKVSNNLIIP